MSSEASSSSSSPESPAEGSAPPSSLGGWLRTLFGTPRSAVLTLGGLVLAGGVAAYMVASALGSDGDDDAAANEDDESDLEAELGLNENDEDEEAKIKRKVKRAMSDGQRSRTANKSRRARNAAADESSSSPVRSSAPSSAPTVSSAAAASSPTASSTSQSAIGSSSRLANGVPDSASSANEDTDPDTTSSAKRRSGRKNKSKRGGAAGSKSSVVPEVELRFPPTSNSRDTRRYENAGAGFCFEYPHLWKQEKMNTPHMPVKFVCRKRGASREESKNAPAVVVCVEKCPETFDLKQTKAMLNQRFPNKQVGADEDFTMTNFSGEDPAASGDLPVPGTYVIHDDFQHPNGQVQPFRQYTIALVRCRKSITLQLVMPRELVHEYSSEVRLFKNLTKSLYVAPTFLQLDIHTSDMWEYTDPEYGFSMSFPSVFRHNIRPKSGVLLSLEREDQTSEDKQYGQSMELRLVPLVEGATLSDFAGSARKVTEKSEAGKSLTWLESGVPVVLGSCVDRTNEGDDALNGVKNVGVQKAKGEEDGVHIIQVCLIHPQVAKRGFLFSMSCASDDEREFTPLTNFLLSSFKLGEPSAPSAPPRPSKTMFHYRSPTRGIRMELPSTWKGCDDAGQGSIAASFVKVDSDDSSAEQLNSQLFVHRLQRPEKVSTLSQLEAFIKTQTEETFQKKLTWSDQLSLTWDGKDAREFSAYVPLDSYSIRLLFRCCMLDKEQASYLQFACMEDGWEGSLLEVRSIFNNCRLLQSEDTDGDAQTSSSSTASASSAPASPNRK